MKLYQKLLAVTCIGLCSAGAKAGLLDYNLVLTGNLSGAVHVEGAAFIGGDLIATQLSEFNHKDLTPVSFDGLEVAGNISGHLKIMHGETAVYNSKDASAQIDCLGLANCATGGVNLSSQASILGNEMSSLAATYSTLTANASAVINGNQVRLVYTGSDELAVFNVNASDIFFQNSGIDLVLGSATRAIINVVGNANITNTNLNGNWDYSNTLWNFVDASVVNFNHMAVKGTVLASNADVFNAAGFDGSLYAKSYTNTSLREIHGFFWNPPVTPPEPPVVDVPEPSLMLLFLGCLGLLGLVHMRRRHS